MHNNLLFSIIIPAYNEEKFIGQTIESVHRTMAELNILNYEIIVCDDGSNDKTAQLAKEAGAIVTSSGKRQIAAARNKGAQIAKGDYLIFLDADTLLNPKIIQALLKVLEKGAVGGGALIKSREKLPLRVQLALNTWNQISVTFKTAAGAFIFTTKDAFTQIGGFNEEYYAAEEWYFSKELKKLGFFVILKEPVQTSARKLENHSLSELYLFLLKWIFMRKRLLNSKKELDFWYTS